MTLVVYEEGPGLKPLVICWTFRRAKALRSLPKSKTLTFCSLESPLLFLNLRARRPNAKALGYRPCP
jgi:hypothetical protein